MDWGNAAHAVLKSEDRVGTTAKVNYAVSTLYGKYDAFMYIGDDHLFSTPHWDTFLTGKLAEMNGTGMLYGGRQAPG